MPNFLEISEIEPEDLRAILDHSVQMKVKRKGQLKGSLDDTLPLEGCIVALIFEKPSTRTRVSFDVGVRQLGGQPILLSGGEIHLGSGETISDTAKVISRFADIAMIRTFEAQSLLEFSLAADIPLINGLTNLSHPCQVMADILTFEEYRGPIKDKQVVWVGVGSNVCNSFVEASAQLGFSFTFSGPSHMLPDKKALQFAHSKGAKVKIETNPELAVTGADLLVTDVWTSMHDEVENASERNAELKKYQVNDKLMKCAESHTLFMHCLPAHREEEVTSSVLDSQNSVVFDEAENRLHVQKGILNWCLNG